MPGYQQMMRGPGPMGGYSRGGGMGGMGGPRYQEEEQDPDQNCKLFVGGLSFETTDASLKAYFSQYGEVKDVIVMKDSSSKRSRGFGFIKYSSKESVDAVQKARPHKVDERDVETKRAMPRDDPNISTQNSVKKMFVGGVKEDTKEDQVRECFAEFGDIEAVEMIPDKQSGKNKGFCFVTFTDYDPVDKLVLRRKMELNGKKVEMKKAFAKGELMGNKYPMGPMGPMSRGGRGDYGYGGHGYPGGYGGYGGGYGGPGGYGGGQGMYGGYNDGPYPAYPPHQGNHRSQDRGYGGNNYGNNHNNYNGGFSRR